MTFDDFFQRATAVAPYAFQRAFAEAPQLPDLLEAPTGSGKTATAILGWLWRRRHGTPVQRAESGRRLVFCLPMRTLVEQTARNACTWRERLGLSAEELGVHVLLGGAVDESWEEWPDRDAILIGTQDHLLSRALMRGYAMSRFRWPVHFALLHNDCTWVMDEVQLMGVGASTAAQLQAFRERSGVHGAVKTVWMTATLDEGRLRTVDLARPFVAMPFAASEPALARRFRAVKQLVATKSPTGKAALATIAKVVSAAHVPGTLTLVIVNRVARAQELRALLAKERRLEATAIVHSRFRPIDRRRIQDAALAGAFVGVIVATQAVEAGVDISARTLFTELAPWSSLVQRFGRLNRAGEHAEATAYWIDIDTADDEACRPYPPKALQVARERLRELTDVAPASLASVSRDREAPAIPVLRHKDLVELFDTEPDLAGHDIDVSRYVRATDDRDVQVAWRVLGDSPPAADAPDLVRDELCTVPIWQLEKLVKGHKVWRFDSLHRAWVAVDHVFSGLSVVVDVSVGGYSAELGFTGDRVDIPNECTASGSVPDADEADPWTYSAAEYVSLATHSEDTALEMAALLECIGDLLATGHGEELLAAARWHDAGKAHAAFQAMMIGALPEGDPRRASGPWAKSDRLHAGKNPRRFFRHELASALAWLAAGKSDLGGYVIAAHHGKVRLSLRARPGEEPRADAPTARFAHGVHDGDLLPATDLGSGVVVPETTLSLTCMELGGDAHGASWSERMHGLLAQIGPFRLAYLEMLVRVADWRASRKRQVAP